MKITHLKQYWETIAVLRNVQNINTFSGQNVEFLMLALMVHSVTARL